MKKIEAIIRPGKLEETKNALDTNGISGLTVTQVIGCGHQKGHTQVYRSMEYTVNLIPKIKIEIVVHDSDVDKVIRIITETSKTGAVGDGKIFVSSLENVVRIRTGESGEQGV